MSNDWLPTDEELSPPQDESLDERLKSIETTQQYLLGRDEYKKIRSDNYRDKQERNPHRFVRFYRMKNKELSKSKMLTKADKAFLFDLLPYISRETNLITSDRGIPMDAKEIQKVCDIGKTTFYDIVPRLIDCGVLIQEPYENKVFYRFNEEYFEY